MTVPSEPTPVGATGQRVEVHPERRLDPAGAAQVEPAPVGPQPHRGDESAEPARVPARAAPRGVPQAHGKRFLLDGAPWLARGVSYGPFRPGDDGAPFPAQARLEQDLAAIAAMGATLIRVYHVPPPRVVEAAAAHGLRLLVGIPWPQHLAFLDDARQRREIRRTVAAGVRGLRDRPGRFAFAIGNEIPPATVRWYGRSRLERFLAELAAVARDADPGALITYGNFPSTEYLDPPGLDFVTFNVYLHDDERLRRYVARLLNVAGERPLLLGELGFDSIREGEVVQAERLARQLRIAFEMGVAGAVAYAWTDDWHTGGADITDWAFGLVDRERRPKPAYRAVRQVYRWADRDAQRPAPRISVVICAYNAEPTIGPCLESLGRLRYPDFEVIVIDDGSKDRTGAIADAVAAADARFRVIHQPNRGLSAARNVGLAEATGEIVAYTDADCVVDPDWLTHLARLFATTDAAAVGGPNIPEVGGSWVAACIAAAPGWPTHVLVDDETAEHIPGCNMAFRREALLEIGGFNPVYTAAGDDVDACWKLEDRGRSIRFAGAGFVWHVARRSVRAYLRQQRGYGRAEAMLFPRHPHRFNGWRNPRWAGTIYHRGSPRLTWGREWVYHGPFGTAPYQLLYSRPPGGPGHLPATVEWQAAALLLLLLGLAGAPLLVLLGAAALGVSAGRAIRFAARARLARGFDGWRARALVALLAYVQPLVRGWASYRTLVQTIRYAELATGPAAGGRGADEPRGEVSWGGLRRRWALWTGEGIERTAVLAALLEGLRRRTVPALAPAPADRRDLVVFWGPWIVASVRSLEELHGGGKRLHRLDVRACPSALGLAALGLLAAAAAVGVVAGAPLVAGLSLGLLAVAATVLAARADRATRSIGRVVAETVRELGLIRVPWKS